MKGRAGVLAPGSYAIDWVVSSRRRIRMVSGRVLAQMTRLSICSWYGLRLWILQANGTHLILWNLGNRVQREILREHIGR